MKSFSIVSRKRDRAESRGTLSREHGRIVLEDVVYRHTIYPVIAQGGEAKKRFVSYSSGLLELNVRCALLRSSEFRLGSTSSEQLTPRLNLKATGRSYGLVRLRRIVSLDDFLRADRALPQIAARVNAILLSKYVSYIFISVEPTNENSWKLPKRRGDSRPIAVDRPRQHPLLRFKKSPPLSVYVRVRVCVSANYSNAYGRATNFGKKENKTNSTIYIISSVPSERAPLVKLSFLLVFCLSTCLS